MAATYEEIITLRNRLIAEHGDHAVELASMVSFFWYTTQAYGAARDANFTLLMTCVRSELSRKGISLSAFERAVKGLDQVNETLTYLSRLND
jgi:hypothetical protein